MIPIASASDLLRQLLPETYSNETQRNRVSAMVEDNDDGESIARVVTDAKLLHEIKKFLASLPGDTVEIPALEPEQGGWQPIETAPKDGTEVLLYSAAWDLSWGIQAGHFAGGQWHTGEGSVDENDADVDPDAEVDEDEDFDTETNIGPTHWHRIPKPPRPGAEQGE